MGLGGLRWACYHIIITWQRLEQYSKYFSLQSQALPAGVVKIDDLCWFQHGSPHSLLRPNYKTVFNPIATNLNILNLPLKFWVGAPTLSIPIKQLLKVWADHFQWHQWLRYAMRFQVPSNHSWLKTVWPFRFAAIPFSSVNSLFCSNPCGTVWPQNHEDNKVANMWGQVCLKFKNIKETCCKNIPARPLPTRDST